ncbi:Na+/H+ antiporter subunit D [Iamia sp. SCSIO 61187]|uniref:proton-conducting transporter transmembrane domain-containing protein n=1 Tax=Iamia sp. SCSIO 61187 TaxID=2722752 RepID=UPI001C6289CF|nr:proton-conducting transporter membrane subunit [Iamia sp. SCSIO 61187]QYG91196.1 Na+/H+ antiporter subunit D [Iamia sp. SCSIO 61187]
MSRLVPLTFALPLLGVALSLIAVRHRRVQRIINLACLTASLAVSVVLLVAVERDDHAVVARIGGWTSDIGITYVFDRLSGLLLVIAFTTMLIVLVFAVGQGAGDERSPSYHPSYLALAAGIAAAFSSGDLFHLFVAFEVLLMASYVLLTLHGEEGQVRSGTTYVIINSVESLLLLSAVGLVYAATGTLSLADLPAALAELDPGLRTGLQLLLLLAFGLKAAVFPLFFWLPDSYPTAPSPVSAVFAGLLTKVGVYALIRTQTLLFPDQHRLLLVVVAALTMLIGVLGAIAQGDVKRILSFHIVSQIGYMVMGLAVGGVAGVAATVFYLIHHIPTKTSLFLVEGIIEDSEGTGTLDRLSGLARRSGPLALLFAVPALSLAGLPPFSGFVGKLGLITAAVDRGQWVLVGVALLVSLLTLVSMAKIWLGAFWGRVDGATPPDRDPTTGGILRTRPTMGSATALLVGVSLAVAIAAGPLFALCQRTAEDLTTPGRYAEQVGEP